MRPRPSTAPIALLLAGGLICLVFSLLLPARQVSYAGPALTPDGRQVEAASTTTSTTTSTDPVASAIAVGLAVLSVASFAGAGWQVHRRQRRR